MEPLPFDFINEIRELLGAEESRKLETALHEDPAVSIRLNASKGFVPDRSGTGTFESVAWCPTGFYLKERPAFTFDPLFHAGVYYVQEASSMFLGQVLRSYVSKPVVALDLCAAPGGKSTHIRSLLPQNSLLVSNELIRNRCQVLAENLIKWGHPGVMVTNNSPSGFKDLEEVFDLVFADVPCSGEGMFRKDPGAIREWSAENVENCRLRQRKIVSEIWGSLRSGGILVYSTCTYNIKENEENIRWIMDTYGARTLPVATLPAWGITDGLSDGDLFAYRFFPHKTKGEGFFVAVLQKPGDAAVPMGNSRRRPDKKQTTAAPVPPECRSWLNDSSQYSLVRNGQTVTAIPGYAEERYRQIGQKLKVVHAGIPLAEIKGKDLIPLHPLALSTALDLSAFPLAELGYDQAVSYLRAEAIRLDEACPKGYLLVTYRHKPLGFVKNIGNRANNLYPQEWRIRSGYITTANVSLIPGSWPQTVVTGDAEP